MLNPDWLHDKGDLRQCEQIVSCRLTINLRSPDLATLAIGRKRVPSYYPSIAFDAIKLLLPPNRIACLVKALLEVLSIQLCVQRSLRYGSSQ